MYNHQNGGDNQYMNKDDKKKRGRSPFRYEFKSEKGSRQKNDKSFNTIILTSTVFPTHLN